jgi:hypothetical protein
MTYAVEKASLKTANPDFNVKFTLLGTPKTDCKMLINPNLMAMNGCGMTGNYSK